MNGMYLQNPSFPSFTVIPDVSRQIRQIRHMPSSPTPEVARGNQGFYIWSVNPLNFYVMAKQAGLVKLKGTIEDLSFSASCSERLFFSVLFIYSAIAVLSLLGG